MLKSIRHSIRRLSQPSRERWQQPIAAGIENVGEKQDKQSTIEQCSGI